MIDQEVTAGRLERRHLRRGAVLSALFHLSPLLILFLGSFSLLHIITPPPEPLPAQEKAGAAPPAPADRAAEGAAADGERGADAPTRPPLSVEIEIVFDTPRPADGTAPLAERRAAARPEAPVASAPAAVGPATDGAPPEKPTSGGPATPEPSRPSAAPAPHAPAPPPLPTQTAAAPAATADILAALRTGDSRLTQITTTPETAGETRDAARLATKAETFTRAAALGYAHARYNLAVMGLRGEGPTVAPEAAKDMLRRAALAGHADAALLAAYLAMWGTDGTPDFVTAHAMLALAEHAGKAAAAETRSRLAERMLPGEVGSAQLLAREWTRLAEAGSGDIDGRREEQLLDAAAAGDLEATQRSLASGANADESGPDSRTPLITAAWRGFPSLTRALLERGADPDLPDSDGKTPLHWAAINGRTDVTPILTAAGAAVDPRDGSGMTPLMRAAWNGHAATVRQLLAAGADPTVRDRQGRSALDFARSERHREIVTILTARGG